MSDILFRNRFRIPSSRLPCWDYSQGGSYCVTICTQGRGCWFGEIRDGEMVLSDCGVMVAEEWMETARRRAYMDLDAWIVMPNHLHGILHIARPRVDEPPRPLGKVIGHFKAACTRRIWEIGHREFAWQPRFYDQILRSEEMLLKYRTYIQENPHRWNQDRLHPEATV